MAESSDGFDIAAHSIVKFSDLMEWLCSHDYVPLPDQDAKLILINGVEEAKMGLKFTGRARESVRVLQEVKQDG
jgi:hypothetical protein